MEGGVTGRYEGVTPLHYEAVLVPPSLRNPDRPPHWTVMRIVGDEREACGATRPYETQDEAQAVADALNNRRLGSS